MNITYVGIAVVIGFALVYLYFRAENYRKELAIYRRKADSASKVGRQLAQQVHDFAKADFLLLKERFTRIQTGGSSNIQTLRFTSILFEAAEDVIAQTSMNDKTVIEAFKEYINQSGQYGYGDFSQFLLQESEHKQQLWQRNTLKDYLQLCKTCLLDLES